MTSSVRLLIALVCAAAPAALCAHHSTAEYDSSVIVEAQGDVTKVLWANPHVRLEISTRRFDGVAEPWLLEGQSPGDLDRARIPRDIVKAGDTVTFAGNPSTRRERRMYVTNVLLEDRTELVLRASASPRWSQDRYLSYRQATIDPARAAADRGDGIFRVWVPTESKTPDWASDPPLTDTARAAWKAYDPIRDDPVIDCTPPGMPQVITRSGRYALRFARAGDDVVMKNEYREIDRVVHMTAQTGAVADRAPTPLGWSTGRWDGAALVVTTTSISWPYFQLYGLEGVPQSSEMTIVERFTPSADGNELRYDISATDPRTFTRTVTATGYRTFRWQPGFEFLPQDCVLEADAASGRVLGTAPTAAETGAADNDFLPFAAHARHYAEQIRGARLVALERGEGHFVFIDACGHDAEAQGVPLCRDREGVDRNRVHTELLASIAAFLDAL